MGTLLPPRFAFARKNTEFQQRSCQKKSIEIVANSFPFESNSFESSMNPFWDSVKAGRDSPVVVSSPSFVPFMTLLYDLERGYLGNVLMDRRRDVATKPILAVLKSIHDSLYENLSSQYCF